MEKDKAYLVLFTIEHENMKNNNIQITFQFQSKRGICRNLIYGFSPTNLGEKNNEEMRKKLYEEFSDKFKSYPTSKKQSNLWPCYLDFWGYCHWDLLEDLKRIFFTNENNKKFEMVLSEIIDLLIKTAEDVCENSAKK